jgi:Spy/CpxP family protein refolding chaperone
MKNASLIVILLLALAVATAWGQPAPAPPVPPAAPAPVAEPAPVQEPMPIEEPDTLRDNLFPPELIMRHQSEIGLTESQRNAIKNEVQKSQAKFLDLQWQLTPEQEKMRDMLQASSIDEAKAMQQISKVLTLEDEIKRSHLGMLIRIKNQLTEEQKKKLADLRPSRPDRGPRPGPRPEGPRQRP